MKSFKSLLYGTALWTVFLFLLVGCTDRMVLGETSVSKLIKALTVEEKAQLLEVHWNETGTALEISGIECFGIPDISFEPFYGLDDGVLASLGRSRNEKLAYDCGKALVIEQPESVTAADAVFLDFSNFPLLSCAGDSQKTESALKLTSAIVHGMADAACPVAVLIQPDDTTSLRNVFERRIMKIASCYDETQVAELLRWGVTTIRTSKGKATDAVCNAIDEGKLDMTTIDRHVVDVLEFMLMTMSESQKANDAAIGDSIHLSSLILECHRQGTVLLKNDGVLPLNKEDGRIALYGLAAYSENVDLDAALKERSFTFEPSVMTAYSKAVRDGDVRIERKPFQLRADAISSAVAVIVAGNYPGETELIEEICRAFHFKQRKVVLIMTDQTSFEVSDLDEEPDAVIYTQAIGVECGRILSELFFSENR